MIEQQVLLTAVPSLHPLPFCFETGTCRRQTSLEKVGYQGQAFMCCNVTSLPVLCSIEVAVCLSSCPHVFPIMMDCRELQKTLLSQGCASQTFCQNRERRTKFIFIASSSVFLPAAWPTGWGLYCLVWGLNSATVKRVAFHTHQVLLGQNSIGRHLPGAHRWMNQF